MYFRLISLLTVPRKDSVGKLSLMQATLKREQRKATRRLSEAASGKRVARLWHSWIQGPCVEWLWNRREAADHAYNAVHAGSRSSHQEPYPTLSLVNLRCCPDLGAESAKTKHLYGARTT